MVYAHTLKLSWIKRKLEKKPTFRSNFKIAEKKLVILYRKISHVQQRLYKLKNDENATGNSAIFYHASIAGGKDGMHNITYVDCDESLLLQVTCILHII